MIGRMYRPVKILNIPGKRGFSILNKYKSNFGGTFKFDTHVYLNYNATEQTEVVQLEFHDLSLPIYMKKGKELEKGTAVSQTKSRKIESLRKLVRPTKISSKESLDFVMLIESKEKSENDVLELSFMPVMVDNEEYMEVVVKCKTPVVINSDVAIKVGK